MVFPPQPPLELVKKAFSPVIEVESKIFLWRVKFRDVIFFVVAPNATEAIDTARKILISRWKNNERKLGARDAHVVKCVCLCGIDEV